MFEDEETDELQLDDPEPVESPANLAFSPKQKAALDVLLNTRDNVLLTGVAGCGKSTIIREFLRQMALRKAETGTGRLPVVCAPTGIAALNVGGTTIHKLFGLGIDFDVTRPKLSNRALGILGYIDTIIIDEISMVRSDLFHMMDIALKRANSNTRPFGGTRIIMVGDPYQLPPVVKRQEAQFLETNYGTAAGWCFLSPQFETLNPRVFYLQDSFRQADTTFVDLLNRVRDKDLSAVSALNAIARSHELAPETVPWLCSYKADMDVRNYKMLRALDEQIGTIRPDLEGDTSSAPKEILEPVELAIGARVMITKNAQGWEGAPPEYVNGSLGWVEDFSATAYVWKKDDDGNWAKSPKDAIGVRLDSGVVVNVPAFEYELTKLEPNSKTAELEKVRVGAVRQYPLTLAWAITIHKAQGMGFDAAVVNLGERGAFAHGQAYVALSRLKSAQGLYLRHPLMKRDLQCDANVPKFLAPYAVGA
jgi:ATP-dependent exoDNAse (exonuclease V) alpha subunit